MSNSSLVASKKWDVFLSFRGEDTRTTFTGHLYNALLRNKIRTFRDDNTLERGRPIESELFKAIEESIMVVIIFSTNYAKSTWCLRELAKVMDCESRSQLTVLPVFYKVDPSDVRAQRNDFSIAFEKPEIEDMIPKWRMALQMAAGISGRALEAKGDEASFIDLVLKDISGILETFNTTMRAPFNPVGTFIDESTPFNPVGTFIDESAPFNPVGTFIDESAPFIHEKGYQGWETGDQMSGCGTWQTNAAIWPQSGCDDHLFWHEPGFNGQVVHYITHPDGTTQTVFQVNFPENPSQSFGSPYFTPPGFFGP